MLADARTSMYQSPWGVVIPVLAIIPRGAWLQPAGRRAAPGDRPAPDRPPRMTAVLAEPVLEASGLSVAVRLGGSMTTVLRDVSFRLRPGRVLGLVGESGAGKSMLARVVAGDLPAGFAVSGGTLRFDGRDMPTDRRALLGRQIAFVPQEPMAALDPVMTVQGQFAEHLERLGVPAAKRVPQILAALAQVRIRNPSGVLGRYPFQLSGGMCQRVLLAFAFAARPALLVADEPTTALDVRTQAVVAALIKRLQRESGTAVLLITHDLRLAAHLCDDMLVLHAGDVVEQGPTPAIVAHPSHPYTRALAAAAPVLRGAIRRLAALPEVMPSIELFGTMPGCRFAKRCPVADPACVAQPPAPITVGPDHVVRAGAACLAPGALAQAPLRAAPPVPGDPILVLDGVARHYVKTSLFRASSTVMAVRTASLLVRAGEFVGVVGESGSGKSTLARIAMGLERTDAGRITVRNTDVTAGDRAARRLRLASMGMVFQDSHSALNPRRTVFRTITQAMEAAGASMADRRRRADALVRMTGLTPEMLDRYPGQLSGGQRQRVNIARALCATPSLLVADEIVSGLDVSVQAQILNLLLDLRVSHGLALLFISHDLAVIRYLCDRVLVMQDGEIVEAGPTEAVFSNPRHLYTQSLLAAVPDANPGPNWPPPVLLEDA